MTDVMACLLAWPGKAGREVTRMADLTARTSFTANSSPAVAPFGVVHHGARLIR
jgi:hypothetical protein